MINSLPLEQRKTFKQCNTCYEIKPLTDYWKNQDGDRGVYGKCKCCGRGKASQLKRERYQHLKNSIMNKKGELIKLKNGTNGVIHKVSIKQTEVIYYVWTGKRMESIKQDEIV